MDKPLVSHRRFYGGHTSVVRHKDCNVVNLARARLTFSKISEALAVQMNGLGSRLWFSIYWSIASINSGTALKQPCLSRFCDRSLKNRSTMLSQEALVGVK